MNQSQIDNLIDFLWQQYKTDSDVTNAVINCLLHDLKMQLEGMKD